MCDKESRFNCPKEYFGANKSNTKDIAQITCINVQDKVLLFFMILEYKNCVILENEELIVSFIFIW